MTKTTKKRGGRTSTKAQSTTFNIHLTQDELKHVRDLMSIILPVEDGNARLSELLLNASELDENLDVSLWDKICTACKVANIEVGEEAPDFLICPSSPPPLTVYKAILEEDEE